MHCRKERIDDGPQVEYSTSGTPADCIKLARHEILDRVDFQTMVVSDQNKKIQKELKIEFEGQIILPRIVLIDDTNKIVWYGGPEHLNSRRIFKFLKKKSR